MSKFSDSETVARLAVAANDALKLMPPCPCHGNNCCPDWLVTFIKSVYRFHTGPHGTHKQIAHLLKLNGGEMIFSSAQLERAPNYNVESFEIENRNGLMLIHLTTLNRPNDGVPSYEAPEEPVVELIN